MRDGVLVLDLQEHIIDLNPCLINMLPGTTKKSIGHSVFEAMEDYPGLLEQIRKDTTNPVDLQAEIGDVTLYYRSSLSHLSNTLKESVRKIILMHDYSQVRQLIQKLEYLSQRDSLTGVYTLLDFIELANV